MKLSEINIRDPFVLKHDGLYYLYGTRTVYHKPADSRREYGFDVYVSSDLREWSGPKSLLDYYDDFFGKELFWAPEVHRYNGKFYMLATFCDRNGEMGTAILASDTPDGKFAPHSEGIVTPRGCKCLDGTLYIEGGVPYMVYCHEWTQIGSGTVCAIELSRDLTHTVGEAKVLFSAGDASWKYDLRGNGSFVTDGPYLMKRDGELICIWSSFTSGKRYCEAISRSSNGSLFGEWSIDDELIFEDDGGHGMVFSDYGGQEYFVYHSPNTATLERPCLKPISRDSLFGG